MNQPLHKVYSPTYPLSSACEEVVFAPFYDPIIAPSLDLKLENSSAVQCEIKYFWCYSDLEWELAGAELEPTVLMLKTNVNISNYNKLILCLSVPKNTDYIISICIDNYWFNYENTYTGTGSREELLLALSGSLLTEIKIKFISHESGPNIVHLSWFGLQKSSLVEEITSSQHQFSWNWDQLIIDPEDWPEIHFEKNLIFHPEILVELRIKKNLPGWDINFKTLEETAERCLSRVPEIDIGDYLPLDDFRYVRAKEKGRTPYHWEALILGFVGLVNNNKKMMYHALRYLCCMLHTRYWVQSAESKLIGSTWDQRCFMEEMTTTSVALLADFFSFALTPHAKELVRHSIWDKGLATIERDMMKYEYLYNCNQGIGFCRARILGGLYLQGEWPRMGKYVDRAYADLIAILNNYIKSDGGIDEGIGYFCQSFQGALPAIIAYSRSQGQDFKKIIKNKFKKTIDYVTAMSCTVPGKAITFGDCRTEYYSGDVIPIMATVFPDSIYGNILKPCLVQGSVFSVTGMMTNSGGILGFIYGPEQVRDDEYVRSKFIQLPRTGVLSSYREQDSHSVRLHLLGSQQYPSSHSHYDKGSIILEIDGNPVLIDRGMVSYTNTECNSLKYSSFHNLLTPVLDGNIYPNQVFPDRAIIPKGRGTKKHLKASIDLNNVWRCFMSKCSRTINSGSISTFEIIDSGTLNTMGQLAFHLHSTFPFETDTTGADLLFEKFKIRIYADWAQEVMCAPHSINHIGQIVYHLKIQSAFVQDFNLMTRIEITF